MIVLDASVVLEILLNTKSGERLASRVLDGSASLHAPHLLDLEVAQVLRRYCAHGDMTARRGQEALKDLAAFPIERYPHDFLLDRVWDLRQNLTAYDAAYLALAEALDATLLTRDAAFAALRNSRAKIELV
jgi:predicted nucleic acid-binding protein